MGYELEINDLRQVPQIQYQASSVPLRDYQQAALRGAIRNHSAGTWWPRGILHIPTGGGKTEIAVAIVQTVPAATAFLVNQVSLIDQTVNRFKQYGFNPGVLAGQKIYAGHPMIMMVQTVGRNIEKYQHLLDTIQQVIVDEAHLVLSGNSADGSQGVKIMNAMPNAFFRWGLSATPLDRDEFSGLMLRSCVGEIVAHVPVGELIADGFLVTPKIHMIPFLHSKTLPDKWPDCYVAGIVMNPARNKLLIDAAVKAKPPILVLCIRVAHAQMLARSLTAAGLKTSLLSEESSADDRGFAIQELRAGRLDAIVATTIFDQGVDIPELRTLILAGGGKAKARAIQRLGRSLRPAAGKNEALIIDVFDRVHTILRRHSNQRAKAWQEQGFEISKTSP